MQYTIRDIPPRLDVELRARARREGKSLNQVAVEAMAQGVGLSGAIIPNRSLEDVAGTWRADAATERALADQNRVECRGRARGPAIPGLARQRARHRP